jgi:hypothetical protein
MGRNKITFCKGHTINNGRVLTPEHKEKIRASLLKTASDGKSIGRPKGGTPWNKGMSRAKGDPIPPVTPMSEDGRRRLIEARIKCWQDPEYRESQVKAVMKISIPNRTELWLEALLEKMYPGEWKFVGDGQMIIAGKCPDYINVNGQKKIIEFWGNRWHEGQNPEDRKNVFKPYGYETLVIWGHELKDMDKLKLTLNNFCKAT